jgi:hypothetical protein
MHRYFNDFFNIFFLKIRTWYISKKEIQIPGVFAFAVISLLQTINFMSLFYFMEWLSGNRLIDKVAIVFLFLGIAIINYCKFYFSEGKIETLNREYKERVESKLSNKWIWLYVFLSISLLILSGGMKYYRLH